MQTTRRFRFWPDLLVIMAAAMATELVHGLMLFLDAGQILVNGQPVGTLTFLSQNILRFVRGVSVFGLPFGVLAWVVLSVSLPRGNWWRDIAIVFLCVAGWHVITVPIDYRLPSGLIWVGPYLVFGVAVMLCRSVARFRQLPDANDSASTQAVVRRVQTDVPCARCSYNLRTLTIGNDCPECGLPIAETLRLIALRVRATPFWKFLPISAGFAFAVTAANLIMADLYLRLRSHYPRDEGLWGNKWLPFVLIQAIIVAGAAALLLWPVFWLCLRRQRLMPALAFLLVVVTAAGLLSMDLEQPPYTQIVVLLVGLSICAWSGIFDRRPEMGRGGTRFIAQ